MQTKNTGITYPIDYTEECVEMMQRLFSALQAESFNNRGEHHAALLKDAGDLLDEIKSTAS